MSQQKIDIHNLESPFVSRGFTDQLVGQPHKYINAQNIKFAEPENVTTDILVVDSSSRNWNSETPSNYTINLGYDLKNVVSMELVDGYVPQSGYVVNQYNNEIHFQERLIDVRQNNYICATIPPGNYDVGTLTTAVGQAMTLASLGGNTYTCTYNTVTMKVTITTDNKSEGIFNLIFTENTEAIGDSSTVTETKTNTVTRRKETLRVRVGPTRNKYIAKSIGKALGFKAINLAGQTSYTGQMVYSIKPQEFIALFVNTEKSDDFKKIISPSPEGGIDGAFAIISFNRNNISPFFSADAPRHQIVDNATYKLDFNPPISFNRLKIQYRMEDGNLYDFNGLDNTLMFEIKRVYNRETISSLRQLK